MLVKEKSMNVDILKAYIKLRRIFDRNYQVPVVVVNQLVNQTPLEGNYLNYLADINKLVRVLASVDGVPCTRLKIYHVLASIEVHNATDGVLDVYRDIFRHGVNIDTVLRFAIWCGDLTVEESHVKREYMRVYVSRINEAA